MRNPELTEDGGSFRPVNGLSGRWMDRTWAGLLTAGQECLKEAGIAEYELDAWYLFEHAFAISRMQYLLCARERAGADESALRMYEEGIGRRSKREPLQHILGVQEFMGLEFSVNQHTLIPRQDTEILVETVLSENRAADCSLLDMCTGSGCIAVSLAALGGYAHVEAADISAEALRVAEKNAKRHLDRYRITSFEGGAGVMDSGNSCDGKNQLRFRRSDLFSSFVRNEKFHMIVSNPPYIPSSVIEELEPEVRDFEPREALDGTADGLYFYRRLADECRAFLKANGRVYFEIGHDQGEAVGSLLLSHGFKDIRVIRDLAGKDRVVCGTWQSV